MKKYKDIKFISPDIIHRYVRKLGDTLDIEFTTDFEKIRNSEKTLIIWNPYGYLSYNKEVYIKKYELYKEFKAKGKPVYIVERGALPQTVFIDKTGFNCESDSYDESLWNSPLDEKQKQKVNEYMLDLRLNESTLEPQKNERIATSKRFFEEIGAVGDYNKIVFVPMQMHNDTVTIMWCDWIKSVYNFKNLVKELAEENPNILFLVKNHPVETNKKYHVVEESHNLRIVDNFHYKDCIKYSDKILTINSGLGLQAMIWDKPAIILGKSFYQFPDINYKVDNKNDIIKYIYNSQAPNKEKVERFIYYLRFIYYTTCFMKKLTLNSSYPTLFQNITFLDLEDNRVMIKKERIDDPTLNAYVDFKSVLADFCLLKTTCLDCIRFAELRTDRNNLYFGAYLTENMIDRLIDKGYVYDEKYRKFSKNDVNIMIEPMPHKTKIMPFYGEEAKVPLPVVGYLESLYGKNWREYQSFNQSTQIVIEDSTPKSNIDIVYFFNNYGWAFEFEANNFTKYTSLNGIPRLDSEKNQICKENCDVVVIPSALHFSKIPKNIINKWRQQNIKIVVQYNSHCELKFPSWEADLVVPSSQILFESLMEKYHNQKTVFVPHLVDTDYFQDRRCYNNFTIGWTGRFHDPIKRTEIIAQIPYEVKLKADYKGFLNRGRSQDDMVEFYNSIDLLLVLSKSEGTPYPLLEAMSCGKMVISTNVGIAPLLLPDKWIINHELDKEIIKDLNNKLQTLKRKPKLLIKEGYKNKQKVKDKLDWKKKVRYLDEIYKQLIKGDLNYIKKIAKENLWIK